MPKYYRDKLFTDQQKKAQQLLIQNVISSKMDDYYSQYVQMYGENNIQFTFDEWLENQKLGRYNKFYSNQKQRTL